MNRAKQILEFLKFSEKLKTQLRDNKLSCGRMESVADHSWQVALMSIVIEPHLKNKVDLMKVLKMAVIHDLTEAEVGDIPFSQTYVNPELKKNKKLAEKQEIAKIKKMLDSILGEEFDDLYKEMEERNSYEAKFVKALDSMEANYQALLFGDIDWWEDIYYDLALHKAGKHCFHENILQELNDEINKQTEVKMKRIGLDVDKIKNNKCDC